MPPAEVVRPSVAALLALVRPRLTGPAWTLLIDGGSGSGKSTLAGRLGAHLHAPVLTMEVLYPGWSGLDAAAALLAEHLLPARAAGTPALWRTWDWHDGRPGAQQVLLPGGPLIVEGCGSLTPASAVFADATVLLRVEDVVRIARAQGRDPASRWPKLAAWRADERRLAARSSVAPDLIVLGGVAEERPLPDPPSGVPAAAAR